MSSPDRRHALTTPVNVHGAVPISSYLSSSFDLLDGERRLTVHIGQRHSDVDQLLAARGARHGIFITAANPRSQAQPDAVNDIANDQLRLVVAERGLSALPHVGRSEDGAWSEDGFFVLDLSPAEALTLAEQFGQFAVVVVAPGEPARLLLTRLATDVSE